MEYYFNLTEYYKKTKYSIRYFDVLVNNYAKENNLNKNDFLNSIGISQSSYNRSMNSEQKVGLLISEKLYSFFGINKLDASKEEETEELLSDVYLSFYYKKDLKLFADKLNECANDNTILVPIYKLFIILINSSNKNPESVLKENKKLYDDIISFKSIYDDDLYDLFLLLRTMFDPNYDIDYSIIENKKCLIKPMHYQAISSLSCVKGDYVKELYYGKKARELFIQDLNLARVATININIFQAYNSLGDYETAYSEAIKEYNYLRFNPINNYIFQALCHHIMVSLIGLKRYDDVKAFFKKMNNVTYQTYIIYLTSLYLNHDKSYNYEYNKCINLFDEYQEIIKKLDSFLKTKTKTNFTNLISHKMNKGLESIFKRMI